MVLNLTNAITLYSICVQKQMKTANAGPRIHSQQSVFM